MSSNMEEGKMKKWGVGRRPNQKERCMKKINDFYELKLNFFQNQCQFSLQQKLEE